MRIKRTGPPIHRKLPPIGNPGPRRPNLPRKADRRVPRLGDLLSVDTFQPPPPRYLPDGGMVAPDFNPMPPMPDPYASDPRMGYGAGPDGGPMPMRPPKAFDPSIFQRGGMEQFPLLPRARPQIPPGFMELFRNRMTPFSGGNIRGPRRPSRRFGAY